jgi:hypothetical protein
VDPIPSTVKQFLDANIDSVDQLEILRLVVGEPNQEHASHALAQELQAPLETIESQARLLESRGLLTIVASQPFSCKHGPRTPELDAEVQQLVKTYLERPVTLIKMVYEKPKDQLRSFSDAFRFKKEK